MIAASLPTQRAEVAPARFGWLDWLVVFLLLGYTTLGRSFAHWGFAPVFIGDATLATFVVFRPFATFGPTLASLIRQDRMSLFAWCAFASLAYGIFETLRGITGGQSLSISLQNLVFHVYPFFLWVGLSVGLKWPDLTQRLSIPLCWIVGIYGLIYVAVLAPLGLTDSQDMYQVGWFGQPNWTGILLLALLSYHRHLSKIVLPLLLVSFVFLAMQSRASWFAVAVCLPVWGYLSGNLGNVGKLVGTLAALLIVGWLTDVRLPSPESRGGGELSVRSLAWQVYAVIDPNSVAGPRDVEARPGTIAWRTGWWKEIWKMVHAENLRTFIGPGYGYPIWDLHPEGLDNFPLRTPHNVLMYTLGYTGWIGVAIFVFLQLALFQVMWDNYQRTGQPFCVCLWLTCLIRSVFDNFYESPHFAITFYLLVGLTLAEAIRPSSPVQKPGAAA